MQNSHNLEWAELPGFGFSCPAGTGTQRFPEGEFVEANRYAFDHQSDNVIAEALEKWRKFHPLDPDIHAINEEAKKMAKKLVNPDQLYDGTPFGMSQAVVDAESALVFVSGQVDWDRQYQVTEASVAGQFEAALDNLRTALVAAGASVDSLLHVRIYIRGELEEHMEALAPILARFLGSSRPAVTGLGVASLASKATLVEVEAVARAG